MRVAVTGARGFIGTHLTAHLRRAGHDVLALGRGADGGTLVPVGAEAGQGEAPDLAGTLAGCAAVIHLAGRRVDPGARAFTDYLEPNVVLTERLLESAAAAGAGRFVLASSRMVYPSWLQGPAREDCPDPPDTFYGLSKRVAEDLVRIHAAAHDLTGVSLRIAQVVGPGDGNRGILPRFVEEARNGRELTVLGRGSAVRDFVDVRDVARAFERALVAPVRAPVVNVGGPRPCSVAELAATVAAAAGLPPSAVRHAPVAEEDVSHYSLDRSLAAEQLGWEPAFDLDRSIRDRLSGDYDVEPPSPRSTP